MATLNLGRLKPVFRSGWNNSTAYNVDDIVVRNNQSYISIQAGTNQDPATATAYWTLMAAKGVDGDSFGLANKEIAFKTNAGALDGIPMGNAGEFLKINSGATGYEYGAAGGGKVNQVLQTVLQGSQSHTAHGTWNGYSLVKIDITPTATSSKIWVGFNGLASNNNWSALRIYRKIGSGSYTELSAAHGTASGSRQSSLPAHTYSYNDNNVGRNFNVNYLDSPNTTDQVSYQLYSLSYDSTNIFIGRTYSDANYNGITRASTFINAWEILA